MAKDSTKRIAARIFGIAHPPKHTETLRAAQSDFKVVAKQPGRVDALADWLMWKAEGEPSEHIARIARADPAELAFKRQPGQPLGSTIPNDVVEQHMPQIKRWMRHFGCGRDKDAFHAAVMGVCEALNRYDPTMDIGIGPYAEKYIKGAPADHLAQFTADGDVYGSQAMRVSIDAPIHLDRSEDGESGDRHELLPADPLSLLHSDLGMENLWHMFGDVKGVGADLFLTMVRNTTRECLLPARLGRGSPFTSLTCAQNGAISTETPLWLAQLNSSASGH